MSHTSTWCAISNGGRWYVTRHPGNRGGEVLSDRRGRYRVFKSQLSAQRAAAEANAALTPEDA